MDLTESIAPKSDQLNAEDLLTGPRTFTVEKVNAGNPEQPVNVHLVELPGRPYRPSKSMRRLLVAAWGAQASEYVGRGLTLYRNPDIKFGKETVGGIEISHMSHIDKALTVALTVTRGKRKNFTVKPLPSPAKAAHANTATGAVIPEHITEQVAQVKTSGEADDYLAWLETENAPEHIKQYARNELKES